MMETREQILTGHIKACPYYKAADDDNFVFIRLLSTFGWETGFLDYERVASFLCDRRLKEMNCSITETKYEYRLPASVIVHQEVGVKKISDYWIEELFTFEPPSLLGMYDDGSYSFFIKSGNKERSVGIWSSQKQYYAPFLPLIEMASEIFKFSKQNS
jgi:hypothetical protein